MKQLQMVHRMETIPPLSIADGFSIRKYRSGEETVWINICKNGLLEADAGLEAWKSSMLDIASLVPERDIFFVCDSCGKPVGTSAVFIDEQKTGWLHMVANDPAAKGHHLGQAMACFGLNILDSQLPAGGRLVKLKTDDFRLPAIVSYLRAGFRPMLYDVDMDTRWKAICEALHIHNVEMLDESGNTTDIIL